MDILKTILEEGLTPSVAFVGVCLVCIHLWKQYTRYVRSTKSGLDRNHDLMREVQDLVKESEQTNTSINNELRALERNIDELGSRLEDLEKLDIRTSGELSSILKELETLRKNMETYQMIISLRGKND